MHPTVFMERLLFVAQNKKRQTRIRTNASHPISAGSIAIADRKTPLSDGCRAFE
jgi:hypothetical protein